MFGWIKALPPWVVLGAGVVVGWVKTAWNAVYDHTIGLVIRRCTATLRIEQSEYPDAYSWLVLWAERHLHARRVTNVMLRRKNTDRFSESDDDKDDSGFELIPNYGTYWMRWQRYFMEFTSAKEEAKAGPISSSLMERRSATITLWGTRDRDLILKILAEAREAFYQNHPKHLYYYTNRVWGDSWSQKVLQRRALDTVYMPNGVMEDILADFATFFMSEKRYRELGIPWRRGYLFHGPPGTGKSTLIQAISSHFDVPIYYVTLTGATSAEDLMSIFHSVHPPCIILIEDADCVSAPTQRGEDQEKKEGRVFSMSDLLNAIDGLVASEQRLLILTTNHLDRLDPALIRAGRIDRRFHIDHACDAELRKFYDRAAKYYELPEWTEFRAMLPAQCTIADAQSLAFTAVEKPVLEVA